MKVLINDTLSQSLVDELQSLGHEAELHHYEGDALKEKLLTTDVLVVRSKTKVREALLNEVKDGSLKLIIRAGVGIDNIDVQAAQDLGIMVKNTPAVSSLAVAELTFAHMLCLIRNLHLSNQTMREGKWLKKDYSGFELNGKTLGLIGFGRISQAVATRAEAFGMNILYYDVMGANPACPTCNFVTLDELYASSDFISLHIPYDKENPFVLDAKTFEKMKDGVVIINCSRGKLINSEDLVAYIEKGKIYGAGLDVFENEPEVPDSIASNPRISLTPHLGASTDETQVRIQEDIVKIIQSM